MRILQVVSLLSPDGAFGGPARVALNQTAELRRQGHDVTLVAGTRGYPQPTTDIGGVAARLFNVHTVVPGTGFPGMAAPGLVRWFRRHGSEFDIVHLHFGRDLMVLPVAALARRGHVPYVLQTHGMVVPSRHPLAQPLDALLTRRLLRDAKAVLYLTDLERRQLRTVARADIRLIQLPNGVPAYPTLAPPPGPPEVLFLGRLHSRKRPELFVEMAQRALAGGVDARFTLVGPDEGAGDAVRAAIGDNPRITWEGPIDPAAVPARLSKASVYVLPAEREPYPMAVLEAMSAGVPVVVCADCGLAPAIAETESGIVSAGTAEALETAVRQVLADRNCYGQHAHDTARRNFGMTGIADRLLAVYRQTASPVVGPGEW